MTSLGSPLQLGSTRLTGRVVFGPHETNLCDGRAFSERHVEYYRRRAGGGVGLIVTEEASVHESDWPYERCPLASRSAKGWRDIVDACAPFGTAVVAALGHSGGQGSSAYGQEAMWAPSRVPEVNSREVPKSIEQHEIEQLIASFAAAARLAVDAGCVGVELNVGQFSLLRQFLSGLTNQRSDGWADKSKLAREVIGAVRSEVGTEAVVGIRLSCDELAPWAGIVPEAGAALAAELAGPAGAPLLDYVTVVRGSIYSADSTRPDSHTPQGFNVELASLVRAAVRSVHNDDVAVFAQGSIVSTQAAASILEEGSADAVEMTRALIADSDLMTKVLENREQEIRPCLLCNQTCQVRDARNPIVTCVMDPRSGHEVTEHEEILGVQPPTPGRVLVVGGGPAGMEAARVLAMNGVEVTLMEASERLGGAVVTAASASGRARLGASTEWLSAEIERLGVEVQLGRACGGETELTDAGAVIVATGSLPGGATFRNTRAATVISPEVVLSDPTVVAGPALVWDPIGGPIGVSVCESLAEAGVEVSLVTPDNIAGNELSRSGDLAAANGRLQQKGVTIHRRSSLAAAKKNTADITHRYSGDTVPVRAATVIDAGFRLPNDELFQQLSGAAVRVVRVGDCVAPRTIAEAILEGRRAAHHVLGVGSVSDGAPMGDLTH